jgi:HK97 family phage major capsid protein
LSDEFKKLTDDLQAGINAIRDTQKTLETKLGTKYDKAMLDQELQPVIDKVKAKLDEQEIEIKRLKTESREVGDISPGRKAFDHWLRKGDKALNPEELKVMKISDDTTGGYLASPEIAGEILKTQTEFSPVRQVATVRTVGRESLEIRTRTGVFSANWQGEVAARNETTGLTFGLERIPTHELCARVDVSNWDLEDSDYNFEQILNEEFGERFGVAEGTSFISGNTTIQPEGILQNANVGTSNSGSGTLLTADGFITAYFTPKSAYTSNFKWLMRRSSMAAAAALKNNNNDYLLRRLGESPVWSILGADVIECPDVPAVANTAYAVIYGDFRRGYTIVDRVGLTILRDPYTAANTGSVIFYARKRVGGKVVMAEAIYKMQIAT